MKGIRRYLRAACYPPALTATALVEKAIAVERATNAKLPFCPSHEGDLLFQLASEPHVQSCLEIGFGTGSTALYLLEGISKSAEGRVLSIDFKQSDFDYLGKKVVAASRHASRHCLIEGNTNVVLPEMYKAGSRFDLVFLDGWKVFDHLLLDVYYAARILNANGFLVFDDARMNSVRKVISILEQYYGFREINYARYETWRHRIWFGLSQGGKDWRRPYRAFIKPLEFDSLPALSKFDWWHDF